MKTFFVVATLIAAALPWSAAAALDRKELVTSVAIDAGITEAEARRVVASVIDRIIESVSSGEPALIDGFGVFRTQQGSSMKSPLFIPSSNFRNAVK